MAAQHGTETPIAALDIVWITAALGCDGDTIAMTAATQPSLEDLLLGAIPWTPKVRLYNPFLAIENGDEFMAYFHHAAAGQSETPFILVVEGSVPNENNKEEGYWAAFGTDPNTAQPILTCEWIDRLAPKSMGSCGRRDLRDLWRNSRNGRESYWLHGPSRLPGLAMALEGRHPDRLHSWMPSPTRQLHGNAALLASHGIWARAHDPA